MWRKLKQLYDDFKDDSDDKIREALDFKNHIIEINGLDFYFAKGNLTDLPDIIRVEKEAFDVNELNRKKILTRQLKDQRNSLFFVLRKEDELIGYISCSIDRKRNVFYINNLALLNKFRNHGLGYFLITNAVNRARLMEMSEVIAEVKDDNFKAQHIFRDLGFKQSGMLPNFYKDKSNAILMHFDLNTIDLSPSNYGR
ncbi:GNAT family N-acetyltransferase [Lactobacillus sp. S2-2]|uniref:GNAT family N-acetyltransferase n=1 Tax=Lactobacillus sp. S2-2 TaxID=2692917 RepID=UPI001F22128D|nr:GNAT family N-acetyltransferase [Lactobacillus sp. S2-2]MCF6515668.1 GNAT family N-acetyltransferase [Lactobacillus sp. S2-2]